MAAEPPIPLPSTYWIGTQISLKCSDDPYTENYKDMQAPPITSKFLCDIIVPRIPCTSNNETQNFCKPHTCRLAMHVWFFFLAVHCQCPSVTLLKPYRACLSGIAGENVSEPLDCHDQQLSEVTYPVTQSVYQSIYMYLSTEGGPCPTYHWYTNWCTFCACRLWSIYT